MKMQGYCDVFKLTLLNFEAEVARGQMFTSDVMKARNVHVERQQRDLSQIFTRSRFLYGQVAKR